MQDEKQKVTASDILGENDKNVKGQKYNEYVKTMTPNHSQGTNIVLAFIVGGIICTIGQALINMFQYWGSDLELASAYATITLVFLSVLLTGLNIYSKIAKFAGAGSVVPITGFANSVAAPAVEFQKEGQVFGIGCKIFTIAGPVILYGIMSSFILGLIYYILMELGVV